MKPALPKAKSPKPIVWTDRVEKILLAAFMCLLATAPLTPSDTPAGLGVFVVQAMLWTLLAVGTSAWLVLTRQSLAWNRIDWLALAYLGWTLTATVAVRGVGDLRSAINSFFQTAAFVLVLLLGRRLLATAEQRQAAITLALALVVAQAGLGLVQYTIVNPVQHAHLRARPEELLSAQGIADPKSPEAQRLLNRALSPEPLATFALTNSLAAYLTPWLLILAAALWQTVASLSPHSWSRTTTQSVFVAAIALLILAACLLLTKSRTSIIAVTVGLAWLAAWRLRLGQRLPWRSWPAGAAIVAVLLGAVWLGKGLDQAVLTEAPISVLYRLQYWRGSLAMVMDRPLLGWGPGNFKPVYTHYKLPEASEEIGDPHNFVLEVATTAGLPALLLLLVLLAVIFRRPNGYGSANSSASTAADRWMLGGTLLGILLAVPLIYQAGGSTHVLASLDPGDRWMLPEWISSVPFLWLVGIPVVIVAWLALRPLITEELLSGFAVPLAVMVMLGNLLAAGGIGFPNVSLPLALLLAVASQRSSSTAVSTAVSGVPRSPVLALGLSGTACLACLQTCYFPVLESQRLMREADDLAMAGQPFLEPLAEAVLADPYAADPCLDLARRSLNYWLSSGDPETLAMLETSLLEAAQRSPRSYLVPRLAGEAHLAAYRKTGEVRWLHRASDDYAAAIARYPNYSLLYAHRAWVEHLARDDAAAKTAAEEALRLDALCPHFDKQLKQQQLADPALRTSNQTTPVDQLMRRLIVASPAS